MTPSRRGRFIFVVALLGLAIPTGVEFYTDWLWFGETGYQSVFVRKLATRASLGAAAAALAFGVLFINVRLALRGLGPRRVVLSTREGPVAIAFDPHQVRAVATVLVALVALLLGWYASSYWLTWLMFQNGQPFGESDPVLGRDVGDYVFRLPFLDAFSGFLLALGVLSGVGAATVYLLTGGLARNPDGGVAMTVAARRHLAVVAGSCLVVLAFAAYLDVPQLLHSPGGVIHGATNVDVAVRFRRSAC